MNNLTINNHCFYWEQAPCRRTICVQNDIFLTFRYYFLSFPTLSFKLKVGTASDPGYGLPSLQVAYKKDDSLYYLRNHLGVSRMNLTNLSGTHVCLGSFLNGTHVCLKGFDNSLRESCKFPFIEISIKEMISSVEDYFWGSKFSTAFPATYYDFWNKQTQQDKHWIPTVEDFGGEYFGSVSDFIADII